MVFGFLVCTYPNDLSCTERKIGTNMPLNSIESTLFTESAVVLAKYDYTPIR